MTSDIETLGGKGANLVRLRDSGFAVPEFVVLGTDEYRAFVDAHDLDPVIAAALARPADEASDLIRAEFRRPIPDDQRARIVAALEPVAGRPLAVRSSATTEDLPQASFAGQQDTFLDVDGTDAVLHAVVECWSSLWTERAITYRRQSGFDRLGSGVALAVVVQEMVDAEVSGVLFTADPLTGHRSHASVDAVFGLGEQLVSGQVDPDHYTVDASGAVLDKTIQGETPTLTDAQLRALVALGRRVATLYGSPQDIEWTRVGDDFQLVQTRPITSLFPVPEASRSDLDVWLSFGGFQGMLDPITPLGQDVLRRMLAGAAGVFGRQVDYRTNPYLKVAAGRLWARFDDLLRSAPGRRLAPYLLSVGDPAGATIVDHLLNEPGLAARGKGATLSAARTAARALLPVVPHLRRSMADPNGQRERFEKVTDDAVAEVAGRLDEADRIALPGPRLAARARVLESLTNDAFGVLLPNFLPIMGPSVAFTFRLRALAAETKLPNADALALAVLRSLPGNVTTAMDLALYRVAQTIAADPASRAAFASSGPTGLAASYRAGLLPQPAQAAITDFLDRYGMRGVAEIDLGSPRWREQPDAVMATLISYLAIDRDAAPDVAYERGRRDALAAVETLAGALSKPKAAQVRFVASRLRGLFGARETPKFTLIRALGLLRSALLASGRDLVDAGVLSAPDDIVFLHADELWGAFNATDLRQRVAARRAEYDREKRRARVPIVIVGDGRTFYDAITDASGADLVGTGVSPGVVEATARVVDDPRTSELRPGEIMVCRGTDPAWTPLFLTASGLITEVGGLMTHGSVVAREYGLPAVVGVSGATQKLRPGQRIRLDGSAGTITFLAEADDASVQ